MTNDLFLKDYVQLSDIVWSEGGEVAVVTIRIITTQPIISMVAVVTIRIIPTQPIPNKHGSSCNYQDHTHSTYIKYRIKHGSSCN